MAIGRRFLRRRTLGLGVAATAASLVLAAAVFAVVNDSGTIDVQVATDSADCPTGTTTAGAKITYLSQDNACGNIGASGTGVFNSFERLEADGSEEGFNTDANDQLDNKDGAWTHSIRVSEIPVINVGGKLYWELFADINENNAPPFPAKHISLNDVEIWFTGNAGITAPYPFAAGATLQYDYHGDVLIHDVNSGSGRADLRYLVPTENITIPPTCSFKNPACATFFVLYSRWGLTENYEADADQDYPTDSGFEEWKVKNYPYVSVSKTAATTFKRTFNWSIDKSVTPDTWNLFTGDSGTSDYTVAVTKTGSTDSDWAVSGTITINNPGTLDAVISSVSDVISGTPTTASVSCPFTFPKTLAKGASVQCTYSTPLPDGSAQTNTATVTLSAGTVFTGTAAVSFGSPTTTVNGTVHVTDTVEGSLGSFSDSGSATYSKTFDCDDDEGEHPNTATITETGQSDSATVTVNCYALSVSKDADESLDRKYTWDIDKSSDDPTTLTLNPGETYSYPYEVTVDVTGHTDSGWSVSGNIHVHNPAPIAATLNSVTDAISGGITATVDCGSATFPYSLAADATLDCTYTATVPNADSRTNTATATLQNHSYASDGTPTGTGTTGFTGTAGVDFTGAGVDKTDECIDVTDTLQGALGTVCVADAPKTFSYSRTFGPYTSDECGDHTISNKASFETNDTGATGDDDWDVVVTVPCPEGCTLTQGYWKTHSIHGPAKKSDPSWALVGGPDAPFFLSGKTWYEAFWTAPKGNPYYQLAHQYMAAKLNILSGADSPASVDAAITWAESFFGQYSPTNWPKNLKSQIISNAGTLGSYNEGDIGPGHCSEDSIAQAAPA